MKKTLFILFGLVILIAIALPILKKNTKKYSPEATLVYNNDEFKFSITYCQPSKKGRLIFGNESQSPLQVFGNYWRMGANEATVFNAENDIKISDQLLKKGKYQLYAIPNVEKWTIAFNLEHDRWGASEPNYEKDVLRVDVPVNNEAFENEVFKISIQDDDSLKYIVLNWDKTQVNIPFSKP